MVHHHVEKNMSGSFVEYQACLQQVKRDNSINWLPSTWKSDALYERSCQETCSYNLFGCVVKILISPYSYIMIIHQGADVECCLSTGTNLEWMCLICTKTVHHIMADF
jgi:hypothetical protein